MDNYMIKLLEAVHNKVETLDTRIDSIDKEQSKSNEALQNIAKDLKYHIRRTDELQAIVLPLHNKYQQFLGGVKLVLALSFLFGFIKGLLIFFK